MTIKPLTTAQKFAAGRLKSTQAMPYFATFIWGLNVHRVPKGTLGTFGVTDTGVLIVDDAVVDEWTVNEIGTVLIHEAMHLLQKHANRFDVQRNTGRAAALDDAAVAKLWNWAADCEINDNLRDAKLELPGVKPLFPDTFGLACGRLAEEYFQEFLKNIKQCPKCGSIQVDMGGSDGDDGDSDQQDQSSAQPGENAEDVPGDHNDCDGGDQNNQNDGQVCGTIGDDPGDHDDCDSDGDGDDQGQQSGTCGCPHCGVEKPQAAGGWCGSGAGRALPGEPALKKDLQSMGRSEVELEAMRRQTAEQIQEAAQKSRGNIPGGLLRWADDVLKPPKIDWRTKLSQLCRTAIAYRPGAVDFRYTRPSRRQGALGYGPGKPILPSLQQPVPLVAVAVDTSGSMSSKDLVDAVSEAEGILRAVGAEVSFLSCDATVGDVRQVRSAQEMCSALVGGGGTSFVPVFDELVKMNPRPEVLVFLTDGWGPAPEKPPARTHTIWVLVGRDATEPSFPGESWGDFVKIDDKIAKNQSL